MPIWQYTFFLTSPVLWVFHEVAAIYSMCSHDSSHLLEATGAPPPKKKREAPLPTSEETLPHTQPRPKRNPYLLNPDALIGSI